MSLSSWGYIAGYLAGTSAFLWMARARRIAPEAVAALGAAGLVGGLLAANAAQWLFGGSPGKTVLGGIAGGYMCVAVTKRLIGLRRPTGDLFAVALCAGEAVGRWGCFFGGCCYGKPARLPWSVWQHGAWRHPTQLYLSAASALVLLALWLFARKAPPENALFFAQGTLYCMARFLIEFWRVSPSVAAGLTAAQWACAAGVVFFASNLALLVGRAARADRVQLAPS